MHLRSPTAREKGHSRTLFGQKTPSTSGVVGDDPVGAVGKAPLKFGFPLAKPLDVFIHFRNNNQWLGATWSLRNGAGNPFEITVGLQRMPRTFSKIYLGYR
jgi:hypothetical protein